ncbi:MAG: T9SS type A sorting domain-containing protein, partial [Urechidicola sp.]|nr:T9SS type A sorting domain-containing protein [Urechidicola sp.]
VFNIYSGNDGGGTTLTNNTVTLNITVDNSSASLEDLEKFNFSYAPNPVTDKIRFSSEIAVSQVEVYNVLGQRVLSKELDRNKQDLDISNLKQGVYIMKVAIEDTVGSFRIIKE